MIYFKRGRPENLSVSWIKANLHVWFTDLLKLMDRLQISFLQIYAYSVNCLLVLGAFLSELWLSSGNKDCHYWSRHLVICTRLYRSLHTPRMCLTHWQYVVHHVMHCFLWPFNPSFQRKCTFWRLGLSLCQSLSLTLCLPSFEGQTGCLYKNKFHLHCMYDWISIVHY